MEDWERRKFGGWVGNSRLKFKMPIKYPSRDDKRFVMSLDSREKFGLGIETWQEAAYG